MPPERRPHRVERLDARDRRLVELRVRQLPQIRLGRAHAGRRAQRVAHRAGVAEPLGRILRERREHDLVHRHGDVGAQRAGRRWPALEVARHHVERRRAVERQRHVDARPAADSGLDPELAPFDEGYGTIHVDTSPVEAEIFIDGTRASLSPCARDVPEGKHEVEARLAGYRTSTTLVDVKAGETTMVDIVLDKHNDMFDSPHGNDD